MRISDWSSDVCSSDLLITFQNKTMMSHSMHLHGYAFQAVALNGKAFAGPIRDTVLVPPMAKVTIDFDAVNTGRWLLHGQNTYHMAAVMITEGDSDLR